MDMYRTNCRPAIGPAADNRLCLLRSMHVGAYHGEDASSVCVVDVVGVEEVGIVWELAALWHL